MSYDEYRVRPVNRYVLTHYQSGPGCGSLRTIGEFPNADLANEVLAVMRGHQVKQTPSIGTYPIPNPSTEPDAVTFAVVGNSSEDSTIVHYAYSDEEATERKAECEAKFGGTFEIFSSKRG